jgi:DtxR family Mn-dependent transcriptional regulator
VADNKFHTVRGYQMLEQNKKLLTSAMEDYLEMIYRNSLKEGFIRTNKLAQYLHVKASSATRMIQKLAQLRLIQYEKYGIIKLTEKGREIGEFLLKRHTIVETFLKKLGVTENILNETELIEHNISPKTLEYIDLLNRFLKKHPEIMVWFNEFKELHKDRHTDN